MRASEAPVAEAPVSGRPLRATGVRLWAGPASLLGLLAAALAAPGGLRGRRVEGVLELHGPLLARWLARCPGPPGGACALTLGHVVLGRDAPTLDRVRRHERVHVRQYERWGPLFIPAYLAASLWALLAGGDPYRDNPFERSAFAVGSIPARRSGRRARRDGGGDPGDPLTPGKGR